eukprot:10975241-Karenia_brevis.AAC.1
MRTLVLTTCIHIKRTAHHVGGPGPGPAPGVHAAPAPGPSSPVFWAPGVDDLAPVPGPDSSPAFGALDV